MELQPYQGLVPIEIGGQAFDLCFDNAALDALRGRYGDDPLAKVAVAIDRKRADVRALSDILSIGLVGRHPELTGEEIYRLNVPFIVAVEKIEIALQLAAFGPDALEEVEPGNPPKNRLGAWVMSLLKPSKDGARPATIRDSSGD